MSLVCDESIVIREMGVFTEKLGVSTGYLSLEERE